MAAFSPSVISSRTNLPKQMLRKETEGWQEDGSQHKRLALPHVVRSILLRLLLVPVEPNFQPEANTFICCTLSNLLFPLPLDCFPANERWILSSKILTNIIRHVHLNKIHVASSIVYFFSPGVYDPHLLKQNMFPAMKLIWNRWRVWDCPRKQHLRWIATWSSRLGQPLEKPKQDLRSTLCDTTWVILASFGLASCENW